MSSRTASRTRQNGAAIRAIREREGLSVSELATSVGISDPHLRNLELEHKDARPETLALIARGLRCPLAAIANGQAV
jgi:transcriptional regulator with XRE-family HTH domain